MPSSACDWSSDVCSSDRSEEHTSELQSRSDLVCRLLLEKKKKKILATDADTTTQSTLLIAAPFGKLCRRTPSGVLRTFPASHVTCHRLSVLFVLVQAFQA